MSSEQIASALAAGAWVWDKYGKTLTDLGLGAIKSKWNSFKWVEASEQYRSQIKELHSTMRILYKDETIDLDNLYVDLFILDKKVARTKYGLESLHLLDKEKSIFRDQSKRASALRIVTNHTHLFIFGKPGTGKTTLLKHLAVQAAQKHIDKIPIFISFYAWAYSGKDLMAYISEQFEICGFPNAQTFIEALLAKGEALLLFDGLDEVAEESNVQERVIRETEAFINQHNKNSVCITCRNSGSSYQFEKFVYVEIADFTPEQVSIFASKWFSDSPTKSSQFVQKLNEHRNLVELAQNPLLLGLLCLIFDQYSRFPEKRIEIYRDAVDALITRWDGQRGIRRKKAFKGFTPDLEKELLSLLALEFSLWGKFFFDEEDIVKKIINYLKNSSFASEDIDGLKVVSSIESQHGLLIKRSHRVYSFPHLTFQEYFAALCIVNNQTEEVIKTIAKNILTPHWGEIVLITFNLLPSSDAFFIKLVKLTNKIDNLDRAYSMEWINELASQLPIYQASAPKARKEAIAIIVVIEKILTLIEQSANECESVITNDIDRIRGNDDSINDTADERIGAILSEINTNEKNKYKLSYELQKFANQQQLTAESNADTRKHLKNTCELFDQGILNSVCKEIDFKITKSFAFNILGEIRPNLTSQIIATIKENRKPICFTSNAEKQNLRISFFQSMLSDGSAKLKNYENISTKNLEHLLSVNIYLEECLRQSIVLDKDLLESHLFALED